MSDAPKPARRTPRRAAPADAAPSPGLGSVEPEGGSRLRSGLPARGARPRSRGSADDDAAALRLARRAVDLAADKKAADIVLMGIGELTTVADYLVICSGTSERQLGAIADGIAEGLRADGVRPLGREGTAGAHWVLLDFGSVVVHVFAPPERDYYQLERLWASGSTLLRVQ